MSTDSPAATLARLVATTFIHFEAIERRALARLALPLTTAQYHALEALASVPAQSLSQLTDRLLCDKGNASGLMDRLTAIGLAERSRDTDDGRRVVVRITPAGRTALNEAARARERSLHNALSTLDPAVLEALIRDIGCLSTLLTRAAARTGPADTPHVSRGGASVA